MKKILLSVVGVLYMGAAFVGTAVAEVGSMTTQAYVDTLFGTKMDKLPAKNTDTLLIINSNAGKAIVDALGTNASADTVPTRGAVVGGLNTKQDIVSGDSGNVMMNTGVAGYVTQRPIYSSTNNYSNAFVTAETVNNAAIAAANSEFICEKYIDDDETKDCLLFRINEAALLPMLNTSGGAYVVLPNGYTELEYLESTGSQYIDLGTPIGSDENITVKFAYLDNSIGAWFGARDGDNWRSPVFCFSYPSVNPLVFMIYSTANTNLEPRYYHAGSPCAIGTPYTINWYGNPYKTATLYPDLGWATIAHESYTPSRNAYLFKQNTPNFNNSSTGRHMRIYYFRVEGKMNLIPAQRDSDGVLGMYDTVNNVFYTNAGSGTFVAGPDVI